MHEYSMASEILDVALAAAEGLPGPALTAVHVTLGPQDHLTGDSLSEAFALAAAGTRAEGATLEVTISDDGRGVAVTAIDLDDPG